MYFIPSFFDLSLIKEPVVDGFFNVRGLLPHDVYGNSACSFSNILVEVEWCLAHGKS